MISCLNSNRKNQYIVKASYLLIVIISFAGCGSGEKQPERSAVSGMVTLDGESLNNAVIVFIPEKKTKGPKARAVITDGKYQLPEKLGPVIGNMRVEIQSMGMEEAEFQKIVKAGEKPVVMKTDIPVYFNEATRLHAEIKTGEENVLNFKLARDKDDDE